MANIEWFDDLTVGMSFRSSEVQITESDIKRFAAEFVRSRCIWTPQRLRKLYSKGSQHLVGILRPSP